MTVPVLLSASPKSLAHAESLADGIEVKLDWKHTETLSQIKLGRLSKKFASKTRTSTTLLRGYAGAQAAIEATSDYYHIHDTLSEHLDVTVAHPKELNQIANTCSIQWRNTPSNANATGRKSRVVLRNAVISSAQCLYYIRELVRL
jgi:hypothetical protein